jgi:hypothetical protein
VNPAVGYPRAMADCIVDLFSYRSCGTAQEFNEAASTASFSLVVLGDLDDEGYEVNRPDAAYAGPLAIGASGLVGGPARPVGASSPGWGGPSRVQCGWTPRPS